MYLFYTPDIAVSRELPEEEAAHALRVLRLSMGDEIRLTDGKGTFYDAVIESADKRRCSFRITQSVEQLPLWKGHLHLALAPTKNMDRIEWLSEKMTEIGVDEVSLLLCRYSERKVVKTERMDKILVSAMKQSLKARKPLLYDMTDFKQFIQSTTAQQKFIAHCYDLPKKPLQSLIQPAQDTVILIGPEGDFSEEEVQLALEHGFQSVSLSPSRLRTETAALVAVHTWNLANTQ